jgi:hypothetical protein
MASQIVAGELEQYFDLDGQLHEIKRQLRQPNSYPFNPLKLRGALQGIIEGKFGNHQFIPPARGRVYVLTIPVLGPFSQWNYGVREAGPETPKRGDIWKVGKIFDGTALPAVLITMVLVNFGPNGGYNINNANFWAEKYDLNRTNPWQIFAISRYRPLLAYEFGVDEVALIATTEFEFENKTQVCAVDWDCTRREVNLGVSPDSTYYRHCWFAYYV